VHNVVVPESNDAEPLRSEPGFAAAIRLVLVCVLATVELEYELGFEADEIYDVVSDRLLAFELVTAKLRRTQTRPQKSLGISDVSSQALGELS